MQSDTNQLCKYFVITEYTSTGQKVTGNVLATLVAGPNIVADLADFFIAYATVPGFAYVFALKIAVLSGLFLVFLVGSEVF